MNTSFDTLTITDAASAKQWKKEKRYNRANASFRFEKSLHPTKKKVFFTKDNASAITLYIAIIFGVLVIVGINLVLLSIFIVIGFVMRYFALQFLKNDYYYQLSLKKIIYIGEKILFTESGVNITNPYQEAAFFAYKEMRDVRLSLYGVGERLEMMIHVFTWRIDDTEHEYYLQIDSQYRTQKLIDVLRFLYKKEIPLKEYNIQGKEMYLLNMVEKENKLAVDTKIQTLIDEIGEKEEKP